MGRTRAYKCEDSNDFCRGHFIPYIIFLSQNSDKVLKGSLNFMTFTTTCLMKQTPKLFDRKDLVIQVDR